MSLQFVIDGYNIIHHPLFKSSKNSNPNPRARLIELIQAYHLAGSTNNKVIVVFDGFFSDHGSAEVFTDIRVIFSEEVSADDKIKEILESSQNSKNTVVVSDDREIIFSARSSRAKVKSVEEFLAPLAGDDCGGKDNRLAKERREQSKDLTYAQMEEINRQMRKRWINDKGNE